MLKSSVSRPQLIHIPNYIQQISENEFLVYSQNPKRKDKQYTVTVLDKDLYACSCPDFEYRHNTNCKHIMRVTVTLQVYQG